MRRKKESVTQFYERFIQRTAIAMFLMAVVYALSAVSLVGNTTLAAIVDFIDRPLGIVILLVLLPVFAKMVWLRVTQKAQCREADSFVAVTFKDAASRSFTVTFLSLLFLLAFSQGQLSEFSPAFFLYIALSVSLATCSGWFLYANRDIDDDSDNADFDTDEEPAK